MFEQMDESVDRCWAFNKAGQRCEMVAGHDRDHNVIIAWGADECWTPGDAPVIPPMVVTLGQDSIHATPAPPKRLVCVMCEHPDHRGKCGREDSDGFECDCSEGITD